MGAPSVVASSGPEVVGSDGSAGLGASVLAGMPRSAVASGCVEHNTSRTLVAHVFRDEILREKTTARCDILENASEMSQRAGESVR